LLCYLIDATIIIVRRDCFYDTQTRTYACTGRFLDL